MVATAPQLSSSPASDPASRLRHLATAATELELSDLAVEARAFAGRVTELMYITTRSPFRWLADLLRLPKAFATALERHALDYLEPLIETNATRVTSDRRRLEHDLRERIRGVDWVAERALERAQAQRERRTAATRDELARLAAARVAIQATLSAPPVAR